MRVVFMPRLLLTGIGLLALTGCFAAESSAQRVDDRTWRIEGPRVAGGVSAPNRRLAEKLCPQGYRVLDQGRDTDPYEGGTIISWTVRCL
jgi:hypothetical protein